MARTLNEAEAEPTPALSNSVVLATLETRNFTFEGVGTTEEEAREALLDGFVAHARDYRLPDGWFVDFLDDVRYRTLIFGSAYRDSEVLA